MDIFDDYSFDNKNEDIRKRHNFMPTRASSGRYQFLAIIYGALLLFVASDNSMGWP